MIIIDKQKQVCFQLIWQTDETTNHNKDQQRCVSAIQTHHVTNNKMLYNVKK